MEIRIRLESQVTIWILKGVFMCKYHLWEKNKLQEKYLMNYLMLTVFSVLLNEFTFYAKCYGHFVVEHLARKLTAWENKTVARKPPRNPSHVFLGESYKYENNFRVSKSFSDSLYTIVYLRGRIFRGQKIHPKRELTNFVAPKIFNSQDGFGHQDCVCSFTL